MKKFFLFLLAAICAVCMGVAVGCAGDDGEYYSLVFRQTNGVTYNCEIPSGVRVDIPSGVEVRAGTEIKFTITLSEDALGEPVVYKNDEIFEAVDGFYTFTINENTVIKVLGVEASGGLYNRLICNTSGASITFSSNGDETLQSGMLVRNGTEVSFEVSVKEPYFVPQGKQIVVKANGEVLTPSGTTYSFIMNGRTEITVENIVKNINLTLVNGDSFVYYYDKDHNPLQSDRPIQYVTGDEIVFDVRISSYYKQDDTYEVQANTDIITRGDDGLYHYTLKDDTSVSVKKLTMDLSFTEREDCGDGSPSNPYKLSRPVDLLQFANCVNSSFWTEDVFRAAYYELTEDIDLQGDQMFIIGNSQNSSACFAGHFNGNGHKISNFFILDEFVEQENYQRMLATSVGMFGVATYRNGNSPVIENLTLENYTINANASQYITPSQLAVGSFVGMGYGVSLINCFANNGRINVTGGQSAAYVGGIIGQQVSAYSDTENVAVEARVVSCQSNVRIEVPAGSENLVYAAGGITGVLGVGERSVSAYVLNSYFTGTINGGLHAGGVVGYASDYTSVSNCYSRGSINAYSPFGPNYAAAVLSSHAGGVVGELGYDAIVYNCFSASNLTATSQTGSSGCNTDQLVAVKSGGENESPRNYGYNESVVFASYDKSTGTVDENFITGTMKWSVGETGDWIMGSDGYPVINSDAIREGKNGQPTINVSFDYSDDSTFDTTNARTSQGYKSFVEWGKINGNNNIPEFMSGNNSYRSYGYYFDAELQNKVPLSFVPTHDITLYIGAADYSQVAGTYYLGENSADRAMIVLDVDGNMFYRNVNISYSSYYVYDGTNLTFYNTIIGELTTQLNNVDTRIQAQYFSYYYNFNATIGQNGEITIIGGNVAPLTFDTNGNIVSDSQSPTIVLFPAGNPLKGLKTKDGFGYGEYYSQDKNTVYGFNPNGSGYKIEKTTNTTTQFRYAFENDNSIKITYGSNNDETVSYTTDLNIGGATYKPYDGFTGVWEAAYGISGSYQFDGTGLNDSTAEWKYGESAGNYGTYSVVEGVLKAQDNSFTAQINDDGFLEVEKDGKTVIYYRKGSLKGEWYFSGKTATNSSISINLVLDGLNEAGYGKAKATFSNGEVYDLNYRTLTEKGKMSIELYCDDIYYGTLAYDDEKSLLNGDFAGINTRFTAFDSVMGIWISNDETIKSLSFSGNGYYNLPGDSEKGFVAIKGSVTINGNKRTNYTLDRKTMTGSFTYSGKQYTIKYNEYGEINITPAGGAQINFMSCDKWFNVELVDESGNRYTFDGGGALEQGGKVTVYNSTGGLSDEGTYKLSSDDTLMTVTLKYFVNGGEGSGTLKMQEKNGHQAYVLSLSKDTTSKEAVLYRRTPFEGNWQIGTVGGKINISKVYADDKATGSYQIRGQSEVANVEFTFHPDGNYLTFNYGSDDIYYINALESGNVYHLSLGPDNTFSSSNNYTCVPVSEVDEYYAKTYYIYDKATDKKIGGFLFDGLGKSTGNVTYYEFTEGAINYGKVKERYTYTIAQFGYNDKVYSYPKIFYWFYEYLLVPCNKQDITDGKCEETFAGIMYYVCDDADNYYAVVYPDGLYNKKIRDKTIANTNYFFDGVGGVTENANGTIKKYTYSVVNINSETGIHDLEFKDEEGNTYAVKLDQSFSEPEDWTISFVEE